jgi:hypothetical protein
MGRIGGMCLKLPVFIIALWSSLESWSFLPESEILTIKANRVQEKFFYEKTNTVVKIRTEKTQNKV